jgi:hypothetical protein
MLIPWLIHGLFAPTHCVIEKFILWLSDLIPLRPDVLQGIKVFSAPFFFSRVHVYTTVYLKFYRLLSPTSPSVRSFGERCLKTSHLWFSRLEIWCNPLCEHEFLDLASIYRDVFANASSPISFYNCDLRQLILGVDPFFACLCTSFQGSSRTIGICFLDHPTQLMHTVDTIHGSGGIRRVTSFLLFLLDSLGYVFPPGVWETR